MDNSAVPDPVRKTSPVPTPLDGARISGELSVSARAGATISDSSRSLADVETELREIVFPAKAGQAVPLCLDENLLYANRRRVTDPEAFFSAAIDALRGRPELSGRLISVLDFNLGEHNPAGLSESNIVSEGGAPIRDAFYHDLLGGALGESEMLTQDEKARSIFEPMRERLADPAALYFHVDHHYPGKALSTVSTSVLMLDLVEYLDRQGCIDELERLASSFVVADHSDADIVLANYVRSNANDPAKLAGVSDLLKDTALLNDYLREPPPERAEAAKIFYDVLLAVEKQVASGRIGFGSALERIDRAIEFARAAVAAGFSEESLYALCTSTGALPVELDSFGVELKEQLVHGAADYVEDSAVLESLQRRAAGEPVAGSITRAGSMVFVWVPDGASEVKNACAVRFLRSRCPDFMEGARVVVTSSPAPGWEEPRPRFVKLRSFLDTDGSFLDLLPVFERIRSGELGASYPAGGRSTAGALGKAPVRGLELVAIARMLSGAVDDEIAKQGLG